jgi:cell division protein ZapD
LVRESAIATQEVAQSGFFQRTLETSTPCQMIRVCLSDDMRCFPEISAGKHRFTVRFMSPSATHDRPAQTDADVRFDLHCCVI